VEWVALRQEGHVHRIEQGNRSPSVRRATVFSFTGHKQGPPDGGAPQSVRDYLCRSNEPVAESDGHCFSLRMDLQLAVDASKVEIDGVNAYAQFGGGGLVVVPPRK